MSANGRRAEEMVRQHDLDVRRGHPELVAPRTKPTPCPEGDEL
jgi:hypothetical protein